MLSLKDRCPKNQPSLSEFRQKQAEPEGRFLSPNEPVLIRVFFKEGSSKSELEGTVQKGSTLQEAITAILLQNGYTVSFYSSAIGDYIGDVRKEQNPSFAHIEHSKQPSGSKGGIQFFFSTEQGWALPASLLNGNEYFYGASDIIVNSPFSFLLEKGGFNGEWDKDIDSSAPRAFSKEPCVSCSIASLHTSSFTAFTSSFAEFSFQQAPLLLSASFSSEPQEISLKLGRYFAKYDGQESKEPKEPEENFYAYILSNPWILMFFDLFGKEKEKWKDKGPANLKPEPARQEPKKEAKGKESNPPNPIHSKPKKEKRPLSRSVSFSIPLLSSKSLFL